MSVLLLDKATLEAEVEVFRRRSKKRQAAAALISSPLSS